MDIHITMYLKINECKELFKMLFQDKNSSQVSPAPKTILKTCKSWKFKCLVKWDGDYFFPFQIF